MGRIIDISLGIGPNLLTWPGDPGAVVERAKKIEEGDAANVSELRLGSHTGTHVDPPVHFLPGEIGVDQLDLDVFYGPVAVADLTDVVGPIGADRLADLDLDVGVERLLLKTTNSELWRNPKPEFPEKYVSLGVDGAEWAVDRGLRLVGIDFLSIEVAVNGDHPVHRTLLGGGAIIVEGLNLSKVEPGDYVLSCLPLKILDGDGAPARAALIEG
ncbi:MAG: cyclase family protein [Actinomycetota bacterium]